MTIGAFFTFSWENTDFILFTPVTNARNPTFATPDDRVRVAAGLGARFSAKYPAVHIEDGSRPGRIVRHRQSVLHGFGGGRRA